MNLSKSKAFNGFILEARDAFECVYCGGVEAEELESIKAQFSVAEFKKHKEEFDAELLANYKEYKDESLLIRYIDVSLAETRKISFSKAIVDNILTNEWETGFLLCLKKDIEAQVRLLELFYEINHDSEHAELMIYCQRLESTENSIDEQDKLISIANIPPAMDSRFEFELMLQECDKLENNTEKIKLITKRLYEFEQWKIQNERVDPQWNYLITDYCGLYYPNFEKLCKVEIEKVKKLSEIENSLTAALSKVEPAVSVKNDMPKLLLKWNSNDSDFLELFAALYQNESIVRRDGAKLSRKDLLAFFMDLFDYDIKGLEGRLTKAGNRNDKTPFLETLIRQFNNYVAEKDAKMEKRR